MRNENNRFEYIVKPDIQQGKYVASYLDGCLLWIGFNIKNETLDICKKADEKM